MSNIVNIDAILKKELEVTKPLREEFSNEHKSELKRILADAKLKKPKNLKRSKNLQKVIDEKEKALASSKYTVFPFSKQQENFTNAYLKLTYNDGTTVSPLSKHYKDLVRKDMKEVSVISDEGKTLFTLPIINDKFLYRKRNIIPPIQKHEEMVKLSSEKHGMMGTGNPKKVFLISTEGRIVFVWDSLEVNEITEWSEIRPYDKPTLRDDEK